MATTKKSDRAQRQRFIKAAREAGASEDEREFNENLRRIATAKHDEGLPYADVIPRLLGQVPELSQLLDEHRHDNDEVLPHVFFGDVTRFVEAELASGRKETVRPVLSVLENAVESSDPATRDLVGASFLENLDPTTFAALFALAGPRMRTALVQQQNYRRL